MRATQGDGDLIPIPDCFIETPFKLILMKIMPEINDTKGASYSDEHIIGRSSPVKTFSHSEARNISWTAHFMVCKSKDIQDNLESLRALEACVYPENGAGATPYIPPPICKIRCGQLLSRDEPICVVLKNYSFRPSTDVPFDDTTYTPYRFSVDLSFEVVYNSSNLPGAEDIFTSGY